MNLDNTLKNETLMFDVLTRLLVGLVHFSRLIHNAVQHCKMQNTALTDCVLSTSDGYSNDIIVIKIPVYVPMSPIKFPIKRIFLNVHILRINRMNRANDPRTSNNLLNPHRSAYCKHHSTETVLLYIYDQSINATGPRKISCLYLLDLSATFDTIDHTHTHRLTCLSSWFAIHGTALNWFRSSLSSRCVRDQCNNDCSSPHTCHCGVPQGSVLCSLSCSVPCLVLFVSPLSLNHHLYADDTQLFLSIHPSNFHSNIIHL